jgi:fucose permease
MDETVRKRRLLLILYLGFISLGLPDTVLGVAWPEMRLDFAAPLAWAGGLLTLCTLVSAGSSILAGRLTNCRPGVIFTVSALMTAAAMLGYGLAPGLAVVAAATLLFGVGQGAVDSTVNAHMAQHYSSRHMNWVHGCWGLGATGGPLVFTAVFGLGLSWRCGYLALCLVQAAFGLLFWRTLKLWRASAAASADETAREANGGVWNPLRASAGVAFYFGYSGLEIVAGLWAASYLVEVLGAAPFLAGAAMTMYWASLTVGRFAVGFIAGRCRNVAIVRGGLGLSSAGLLVAALVPGVVAFTVGLGLLGLGLAPLYPTMMHETAQRTGPERAGRVISFQVGAALAGGAVLPFGAGCLIQRMLSLAALPWLLLATAAILIVVHELSARGVASRAKNLD